MEQIVKSCKLRGKNEEKIDAVYSCYLPDQWSLELIARVPQLFVLYKLEPQKLKTIRETFNELFTFFQQKNVPELIQKLLTIQVEKINSQSTVLKTLQSSQHEIFHILNFNLDKIHVLTSTSVQLTMKLVHEKMVLQDKLPSTIFAKLKTLREEKVLTMVANAFESQTLPTLVIDCDGENIESIVENFHRLELKEVKTNIAYLVNVGLRLEILSKSIPLAEFIRISREKFAIKVARLKKVNFQGISTFFCEILRENSEIYHEITSGANEEVKIGKELEFEDEKVHIERKFYKSKTNCYQKTNFDTHQKLTIDEIIKLAETNKIIVLAEEPGSGKSIELKMTAKKLKQTFPTHWVEFIDLKLFEKVFQENEKIPTHFNQSKNVLNFLANKMLKLEGFDSIIFLESFNKGKIIILMDGFDEISSNNRDFAMNLMKGYTDLLKNQLWVAIRPSSGREVVEKLRCQVNPELIKFAPFTNENQRSFFRKFFENKQILEKFENSFKLLKASITNPLALRIVVELFKNGSNFENFDSNLYSIYESFIYSAPPGDHSEFKKIIHVIKFETKKNVSIDYEDSWPKNSYFKDLQHIGSNGNFIHRTFGEFHVAGCLVSLVFRNKPQSRQDVEKVKNLWLQVMKMEKGEMIRKFLDFFLESSSKFEHYQNAKFLLEFIDENFIDILHFSAVEGCINLIKFVFHLIEDQMMLQEMWLIKSGNSVLMSATFNQPIEFVQELWRFASTIFDQTQMKQLLMQENEAGENVLNFSFYNDLDQNENKFMFFMENTRRILSEGELERFLSPKKPIWENLCFEKTFYFLLKVLTKSEFRIFTESKNCDGFTLLHSICAKCDFDVSSLDYTAQMMADVFRTLDVEESRELILKKGCKGQTALMLAAENENEIVFKALWKFIETSFYDGEQQKMLQEECKWSPSVLHCSARNHGRETFETVYKIYTQKLNIESIKSVLIRKNGNGKNILNYGVELSSKQLVESLWRNMQKVLDSKALKTMLTNEDDARYSIFDYRCWDDEKQEIFSIFKPFIIENCLIENEKLLIWFSSQNFMT